MLHGTNADRNYYYSAAVLNGDGQNYKNVDGNFDLMARGWIAPLSFMGAGPLHDITLGGSYWTGNRTYGLPLANQTTAGGFTVLNTSLPKLGADSQGINQQGRQHTWALEVNAPIDHKFGARWEYVHKDQPLSAIDTTMSTTGNEVITAGMHLKGWSTYGEAWVWALGDDRIIGEPGMQMPTRYKKFGVKPPQQPTSCSWRGSSSSARRARGGRQGGRGLTGLAVKPALGQTKLTAFTLGANYWISKRFRTTFNWTLNDFGGDTSGGANARSSRTERDRVLVPPRDRSLIQLRTKGHDMRTNLKMSTALALAGALVGGLLAGGAAKAEDAAITVKGSDTMVVLGQRWAEEYMAKHKGTTIQVTGGGSGTGISALINGTTDVCEASRAMKDAEKKQVADKAGGPPVEIVVAKDGLSVYVNDANPLTELSMAQLKDIYTGKVTDWKDVGGTPGKIIPYSRENSSGTYVFFKEHVLSNADYTPRAQAMPGTAAVVNAVARDKSSIGYGGAAYAKGIKVLKVKKEPTSPGVLPTDATIHDGTYPLSRPLFFYLRPKASAAIKAFTDWVLSAEGQAIVVKVGYFPIK